MINFNKAPFLKVALDYIKDHPGCCKRQVIYAIGGVKRFYGAIANRSYSYRNAALSRLVREGYVQDRGHFSRCSLYAQKNA